MGGITYKVSPTNWGSNFEIGLSKEAKKDLMKLARKDQEKVLKKIVTMASIKTNNVKRLQGNLGDYFRLRVGKIRVVFQIIEEERKILVNYIGFRGSIYKN